MALRARSFRFLWVMALLIQAFPLGHSSAATARGDSSARDGNVVSFATLSFSAPLGLISEMMRRDVILARALQSRGKVLQVETFLKGQDMGPAMSKGEIDIALTGDMPALVMAMESDIIIAGLAKLGSGGIVSRKRYGTLSELRGKRIGVPQGSNVYYGLLIALETAGMGESDIVVVFMEPNELIPALIDKKIEAMSIWPPVLDSALHDHPDLVVLQRFLNSSYIILRRSFAEQQPEITTLVLAAYLRALRWMKDDPGHLQRAAGWTKERVERFQKHPFASLELICATTERDILAYAANPSIPPGDFVEGGQIHKLVTFLQMKGKLPAATAWPRLQKSLDRHLVRGILAQPEKYLLNTYDYGQ